MNMYGYHSAGSLLASVWRRSDEGLWHWLPPSVVGRSIDGLG